MAWAVAFRVAARVAPATTGGAVRYGAVATGARAAGTTGRILDQVLGRKGGTGERREGPQYNLTITASVDASAALRANNIRLQRIGDMRKVWDYIADDFAKKEKTVFSKGGMISGFTAWAPLSDSTVNRKLNSPFRGNANRILVRSGNLRSSLTQRSHPNFVFRSNRRFMEIGTSVRYAGVHDAGDPNRNLPKRTLIRIPDNVQRKWNSAILRHLVNIQSFGFERLG